MATTRDLEALTTDYRWRVAEIRFDPSLSWERKELKIRELGKRYDRERKKLQGEAA